MSSNEITKDVDSKEKVVIYGCGCEGKRSLEYIRSKYDVLCYADSKSELWGIEYDGIEIMPPSVLDGFRGKIIIAVSCTFVFEVVEQLVKEGTSEERLFIYRRNEDGVEEIIPIDYRYLDNCLKTNSFINPFGSREGILLLCDFYSSYPLQLIRNITSRCSDIHFDIITSSDQYLSNPDIENCHIYTYRSYHELYEVLLSLPKYEIIHGLWIETVWAYFSDIIRSKCTRLIMSVGGSDLYRATEKALTYKRRIISVADMITVETDDIYEDFLSVFPECSNKVSHLNYGLEPMNYLVKNSYKRENVCEELEIPFDKITVICGHNASEGHQHISIIKSLNSLDECTKKKLFLIFPMTYPKGNEEYIGKVEKKAKESGIQYHIFKDFLSVEQVAKLDSISDIMIHIQITDSFSSSMLERLYTECVVINGSWLPYKTLKRKKVKFWEVDSPEDLTLLIEDIVLNYSSFKALCATNKEIIYRMSSWNNVYKDWINVWKGIETKECLAK